MNTLRVRGVGPVADAIRLIRQLIDEGGLHPGDRLPTERAIALQYGLSRTAVRGALAALQEEGLVLRQVGRGTFLAPSLTASAIGRFALCSPAEIMSARVAIEPEMLPQAVTAAVAEDIAQLRSQCALGEAARDSATFEEADLALHHRFALATHNSLLIMISELLIDARTQPVWGTLQRRAFDGEQHDAYCRQHRAIVDALAERDARVAQQAMRSHLEHVRISLLG
jgi:DNA-binding FadR family transcriptional regulator